VRQIQETAKKIHIREKDEKQHLGLVFSLRILKTKVVTFLSSMWKSQNVSGLWCTFFPMIETPINVEQIINNMTSSLKNVRLVGQDLVVEPVQPKECVMKTGSVMDLFVWDDENATAQCMCIVADAPGSMPYQIDKRIKDAICGDVYTGFQIQSADNNTFKRKDMVVIKVISLQKLANLKQHSKLQEDPIKEISILQMIDENSDNVCDQLDCIRDDKYIYSIMRHYGDELFNYAGKISEDECRDYFRQIVNGVNTLQKLDICHRDLSLENILLSSDGECTIIDFGMSLIYPTAKASTITTIIQNLSNQEASCSSTKAIVVSDEKQVILMPPQGTCGKKNYIAPEILTNLEAFNGAMVDNWALGVILFMLLTGRPPFHRASMLDKWYRMIQQERLREMLSLWKVEGLSDVSVDLLQKLLKESNPRARMATDDILQHPWLLPVPSIADDDSCAAGV
jgi:serine/threonine protein kinase